VQTTTFLSAISPLPCLLSHLSSTLCARLQALCSPILYQIPRTRAYYLTFLPITRQSVVRLTTEMASMPLELTSGWNTVSAPAACYLLHAVCLLLPVGCCLLSAICWLLSEHGLVHHTFGVLCAATVFTKHALFGCPVFLRTFPLALPTSSVSHLMTCILRR
jgi:hypothetical protein